MILIERLHTLRNLFRNSRPEIGEDKLVFHCGERSRASLLICFVSYLETPEGVCELVGWPPWRWSGDVFDVRKWSIHGFV